MTTTTATVKDLKKAIVLTAAYYGKEVSDEIVQMYVRDFAGFKCIDVIGAYSAWRRNPKNFTFPLPAQIMGLLKPEMNPRQEAIRLVDLLQKAVDDFGWANEAGAKNFLGDEGWKIVIRLGGWEALCSSPDLYLRDKIIYAQVRDRIEVQVHVLRSGMNYEALPEKPPLAALPEGVRPFLKVIE